MKAVTWHGRRDVRVDEVPDPRIQEPTDVVVKVTSTAPQAYEMFQKKQDGAVKVLLKP